MLDNILVHIKKAHKIYSLESTVIEEGVAQVAALRGQKGAHWALWGRTTNLRIYIPVPHTFLDSFGPPANPKYGRSGIGAERPILIAGNYHRTHCTAVQSINPHDITDVFCSIFVRVSDANVPCAPRKGVEARGRRIHFPWLCKTTVSYRLRYFSWAGSVGTSLAPHKFPPEHRLRLLLAGPLQFFFAFNTFFVLTCSRFLLCIMFLQFPHKGSSIKIVATRQPTAIQKKTP